MNKERVYNLLSKNELNEQEQTELDTLINTDPVAKEIYSSFNKIKSGFKSLRHPVLEEISDYVLYKNNMGPEYSDTLSKIPSIENHIKKCNPCNKLFLELNQELHDIDIFVTSEFSGKVIKKEDVSFFNRNFNKRYYGVTSFAIIFFVLFISLISSLTTPRAFKVADLGDSPELYITRGRLTNEFQEGLIALESDNYTFAIKNFKNDIDIHNSDPSIFYSCYILGLTYLESSKKGFGGLFESYDLVKVEEGIKYLQFAIAKNNSGNFPNVTFDSEFFLAKAMLMKNNIPEAKKYLQKVIVSKGAKMDEALLMLSKLQE